MPLLLGRNEIARLLPMPDAIRLAREAFSALARGEAEMPQRIATRVPVHAGTHLSMPCYVRTAAKEILAVKVVTVFERNGERGMPATLGNLLLHDPETGALRAIMDAEELTSIRTGAASALATDLLAPAGPHVLAVIGAGGQAAAQVEGMLAVRPLSRILIHSRTPLRAEKLAKRLGGECFVVKEAREAVEAATLVCCATNSGIPVVRGEWLRAGAHVNAIGAFRPEMAELDAGAVGRARVFVDRLEAAKSGAGDLIQAHAAGRLRWEDVTEIGDVAVGKVRFERREGEVTLFKSVGTAVQDAFAADWVWRAAVEAGAGRDVEL